MHKPYDNTFTQYHDFNTFKWPWSLTYISNDLTYVIAFQFENIYNLHVYFSWSYLILTCDLELKIYLLLKNINLGHNVLTRRGRAWSISN